MKNMQNQITVDFKSNPDLAGAFAGKQAGDNAEIMVKFQISAIDGESVTGTIESVECEGMEDEETEPQANTPAMVVIGVKRPGGMKPKGGMMENDKMM